MLQTLTIPSYSSPGSSDGFFGSITKGSLELCDGEKKDDGLKASKVQFQFNPEDITVTRDINWSSTDGRGANQTQNFSGATDSISFALLYDATEGGDWDTTAILAEVDSLVKLSRAVKQDDKKDSGRTRPPYVKFALNAIKFVGGIESLTIKYVMLDGKGNPMRITVDMSLKGIAYSEDPTPLYNASKDENTSNVDAT